MVWPLFEPGRSVETLHAIKLHQSWLSADVARAEHDGDGFGLYDLTIDDGQIRAISPSTDYQKKGRIIAPCFVDCHTHLDKGHIWPRAANPDGSFIGALETVGADRQANWSAKDVRTRMDFSLKSAFAHGTKAIRTHLDSLAGQEDISWPVFAEMREKWAERIDLQAACLFGIDAARDEVWFERLVSIVKDHGGILGAVTYMVPDLDELLDRIFAAAIKHDLALDFHADETDDTNARSLHAIANAAKRHRFEGQILIGHCCSLARQPDDLIRHTLDDVAEQNIAIVSLPMCNMYLQDRRANGTTPRWRGVTLLHEMAARGITTCVASDNTRDPFYAYGDLDMLEVYRMATRTCHFDHPVGDWPKTVLENPASAMGLSGTVGTFRIGGPADFIVFRGRSWTELLSRPESDRVVVRNGIVIDRSLPSYAELDHLFED